MLSIIVAIGKNNEIGINNRMPWHLPNDLKYFRKRTSGHTIIMGRKTFASLPHPLPHRKHIILTRDPNFKVSQADILIANSIPELLAMLDPDLENFVIGGAEIYRQLLPHSQRLYLTIIEENFEADTFFPEFDQAEWKLISTEAGVLDEKNHLPHRFLILERI